MTHAPLLNSCTRIAGTPEQHVLLQQHCQEIKEWHPLLSAAEQEGMSPLLKRHLDAAGVDYPVSIRRSLSLLVRRHQHLATIRTTILEEVIQLLAEAGIQPLILKGAALAYTLYPDPALRPMRDIDLLFRKEDAHQAQRLLIANRFVEVKQPMPDNHFHLLPLFRQVEDSKICIEVHQALYPDLPPNYPAIDFNHLLHNGRKFRIGDSQALTFNLEETLHYLFQHAFRAPLTYESFKLINVTDIVVFLDHYYRMLDWQKMKEDFPIVVNALPLIHTFTPLQKEVLTHCNISGQCSYRNTGKPFSGWPRQRLEKKIGFRTLQETFWPSEWWCRLYYGIGNSKELWKCRCYGHPKHIFWWIRFLYSIKKQQDLRD